MCDSSGSKSPCRLLHSLLAAGAVVILFLLLLPIAISQWGSWRQDKAVASWGEMHLELAGMALEADDYDRAERILEEAVKLDPANPKLRLEHMRTFAKRAAERPQSLEVGELEALEYSLEVLAASDITEPAIQVARVRLALRNGDQEEARKLIEKEVANAPEYVHGHLTLAHLERLEGRPLEALAAFEKAVEADPENLTALNNLGVQYVELDRQQDGLKMFDKAIEAKDNVASRLNAGDALAKLERVEEGIAHLQQAVRLSPNSAEVRRRLGTLLHLAGKLEQAEKALLESLRLQASTTTAQALGVLYQSQKRFDKAVQVFGRLVEAEPNSLEALFQLALSLNALGRVDQAVAAYQRFIAKAETDTGQEQRIRQAKEAIIRATPARSAREEVTR